MVRFAGILTYACTVRLCEGLDAMHSNRKKMNQWTKAFPSVLNDTDNLPVIMCEHYERLSRSQLPLKEKSQPQGPGFL